MNKRYLYLILISFLVAGIISLFASSAPDGLEKVAEDKGFIVQALEYPFRTLMPDYLIPEVDNEYLAAVFAGIMGIVIVFLFVYFISRAIVIRR